MREHLPRFHRPHDRGVDRVPPVLVHVLHGLLLLVHGGQRHLDASKAIRELGVEAEDVARVDRLPLRDFREDLVLGARQRVQRANHVLVREVQTLFDLLERQRVRLVEEEQTRGLKRRDLELDRLRGERRLDVAHPQRVDPRQLPVHEVRLVEVLERLHALDHLLRERELHELVRRPKPGGEHGDLEVNLGPALVLVLGHPLLERGAVVIPRELQVRDHALHLRRELRAALLLELREDRPLVVVVGALVEEQPPRQLLAVKLREEVLVADVRQQPHDLLERLLHGVVAELLAAALLEQVIAKRREQLRGRAPGDALVAKHLERLLQRPVEQRVVAEAVAHVREVLVVELDDVPHEHLLRGRARGVRRVLPRAPRGFRLLLLRRRLLRRLD
mmetsp:Transcript_11650/g.41954  ORF Transcript_11650/g.41954 Transcript_11650/m.41954 type:complete len:390 (-) Transcript_11650:1148-2317(-)